jgi:hypothetical protein
MKCKTPSLNAFYILVGLSEDMHWRDPTPHSQISGFGISQCMIIIARTGPMHFGDGMRKFSFVCIRPLFALQAYPMRTNRAHTRKIGCTTLSKVHS